jgi:hypothetical protein
MACPPGKTTEEEVTIEREDYPNIILKKFK